MRISDWSSDVCSSDLKHNGPVTAPSWALAEYDALHPLDLHTWPSLEAKVAALADDIAYDNHDIDDGLRAGLFTLEDLLTVPVAASRWDAVRSHIPQAELKRVVLELRRKVIRHLGNKPISECNRL